MQTDTPTIDLTRALIQKRSVTPTDDGCQDLLATRLASMGFECERLPFGDVQNLWARRGSKTPVVAFAGHTDVVPTGPEEAWSHPPFQACIENGILFGRGAADMKGSIAAFVTACARFLEHTPDHNGSLAMLITSDEEGPAVDGTVKVVQALGDRGEHIDYCIVGEPSSSEHLGDVVRHGRRGSLNGRLLVRGVQGHVAYPDQARNPIHAFADAAATLAAERWDEGNVDFPPTSFQFSNVKSGTGATNVIPGTLEAWLNFRFSTEQTADGLQDRVRRLLKRLELDYDIEWSLSGNPFLTRRGRLIEAVNAAVLAQCGRSPTLSTGGGTSDARFIAPTGAEVIELGPVNATIHMVNEHVSVADLNTLSEVYEGILRRLLA